MKTNNVNDVIVIRIPKSDIECARNYPFTYLMNATLRGMRRRYSEQATHHFGSDVDVLFPSALSKMMNDHLIHLYKSEGFELSEDDFEDSEQYSKYLNSIKG